MSWHVSLTYVSKIMVNPGAFRGLRKEFLLGEKETYSTAIKGGYEKDALMNIQRRYFKRFPIDLPHDVEPSNEHLASVNDDVADPEPAEPNKDKLSAEEYEKELAKLEERQKLIVYRQGVCHGITLFGKNVY